MCEELKKLLRLPFRPVTSDQLISWLLEERREAVAAGYLNAHIVNLALRKKARFAKDLSKLDLLYADGMAVVKEARRRGIDCPERVSAADFFPRFCWNVAQRNVPVAFVGGHPGVAGSCADFMRESIPNLAVVYRHHGFFKGEDEEAAILSDIKASGARVVLLSMGSPQQEHLALRWRDRSEGMTYWCVGALFEYYSNVARGRAPAWAREAGLEWVYRLVQEPARLGRRYILGNVEFLLRSRGLFRDF